MKKIKLILTTLIGTSAATAIITPIATSCSSNENNSISETNYYEEINNAEKHLITEQSAIDLNNLFNANINSRTGNINLLTKEEIAEKVVLDKENFIYKKLEENNLNKIFEESAIDVIYQSYLNQINETQVDNNLSRCGSIFSKHFWESVWMGIRCTAVYGFSLLVVYSPVLPILAEFILTGNYKNFISKKNNLQNNIKIPKFLISLVIKTAIETKVFKNKTQCKWSFYIWNGKSNGKADLKI